MFFENTYTTVCSKRELRYYELAPILYVNQEIIEDQINFRYALHPKDQDYKIRIKVKKIPQYLNLFKSGQKIQPSSNINLGDNLGYSLNVPINPNDDKIILSTGRDDKEYQVRIELRKPPVYLTKKISLKKGKNNIFKKAPLPEDIDTIKFKKNYLDNIFWSSDEKYFEKVEQDREYDSKLKFFFSIDYSVENDTTFTIKFVLKDKYGISSDILEMFTIVDLSFEWYIILIIVVAIFVGFLGFYKWMKEKKNIDLWELSKQGTSSCCGWLKANICCWFMSKDPNSSYKAF